MLSVGAIGRRAVLAGGGPAVFCARAGWAVPAPAALNFAVSRNGRAIGTHTVRFIRAGTALTVRIEAAFRVGFGPITLYRYHHEAVEEWRDGAFLSLRSETNDNGNTQHLHAQRVAIGIALVSSADANHIAPPGALPLTHWALASMAAPLFNPQTGRMAGRARLRGAGTVHLANGKPIAATSYAVQAESAIEDWYDSEGVWAALDGTGTDGSAISYRRV